MKFKIIKFQQVGACYLLVLADCEHIYYQAFFQALFYNWGTVVKTLG